MVIVSFLACLFVPPILFALVEILPQLPGQLKDGLAIRMMKELFDMSRTRLRDFPVVITGDLQLGQTISSVPNQTKSNTYL